jgi:integrase
MPHFECGASGTLSDALPRSFKYLAPCQPDATPRCHTVVTESGAVMASIRKRNGKYQVQIRRQDMQPVAKSFVRLSDAKEWARTMEVKADLSELPPNRDTLKATTLGDLVTLYRDSETPRKKGAVTERTMLNAFLRHPICQRTLAGLGRSDFANFRDERLANVKPASVRRQLMTVQAVFTKAMVDWDFPLKTNPVSGLKLPTGDNKRQRRLSSTEWLRLQAAVRDDTNPLTLPIVRFALETAMRRGELLALTWRDVDLSRKAVTVREAKSGMGRVIPLTSAATEALRGAAELHGNSEADAVFPIAKETLHSSWRGLVKRAKITDLKFHDLRHEAISRLFEVGLTVPEVASISGHRTIGQLFRYAHAAQDNVRAKLPEGLAL